jgi:hypothetical protein
MEDELIAIDDLRFQNNDGQWELMLISRGKTILQCSPIMEFTSTAQPRTYTFKSAHNGRIFAVEISPKNQYFLIKTYSLRALELSSQNLETNMYVNISEQLLARLTTLGLAFTDSFPQGTSLEDRLTTFYQGAASGARYVGSGALSGASYIGSGALSGASYVGSRAASGGRNALEYLGRTGEVCGRYLGNAYTQVLDAADEFYRDDLHSVLLIPPYALASALGGRLKAYDEDESSDEEDVEPPRLEDRPVTTIQVRQRAGSRVAGSRVASVEEPLRRSSRTRGDAPK